MKNTKSKEYIRLLTPWIKDSQQYLYTFPDRPELMCYGTGYNSWGVQTNQKALSAFAVAALDPDSDFSPYGLTREEVLEQAMAMLRFSLQSHIEGDYCCADGEKWGHTWISALGIERMMHGVELLIPHLTIEDQALLRKVLVSEADWLLEHYTIEAGLIAKDGKNKPESNIWNGAILSRVATMYPDTPNAEAYKEKATHFFINGISLESDETNFTVYDGIKVRDSFRGANFFNSFALDHHGYMNLGYMIICLSNIAMLHFFYKNRNEKPPAALYHNAKELWALARSMTYEDGRLNRIGGDTRIRYCYCQDYALPAWLLAEDVFDEDCSMLEDGWLNILRTETDYNGDGSFLSARCAGLKNVSPLYYTRLESDRGNAISMMALWHRQFNLSGSKSAIEKKSWFSKYHGAYMLKGEKRMASFVWRSAEPSQGQCAPVCESSLLEWRGNLTGQIHGLGSAQREIVLEHSGQSFEGGFITYGKNLCESSIFVAEGQKIDNQAIKSLAFAALPDDRTVLCIQSADAKNRTIISQVQGLLLNVPNDLFNHSIREYATAKGIYRLHGGDRGVPETINAGKWLCVDNKVGVVEVNKELMIVRPGHRQISLKSMGHGTSHKAGALYCDEVCSVYENRQRWYSAGEHIYDSAFAIIVGDSDETQSFSKTVGALPNLPKDVLSVVATGEDGQEYALVFNLSGELQEVGEKGWRIVATGEVLEQPIFMEPDQACLFTI